MCDLWKNTLLDKVPVGGIPAQIEYALTSLGCGEQGGETIEQNRLLDNCRPQQIKLYNSGSFFDRAAIPPQDYQAIAEQLGFAERVIVESHPRLIGKRALDFRDLLEGSLEVAMGLETAHPETLERLNKKFDLNQFAAAADFRR